MGLVKDSDLGINIHFCFELRRNSTTLSNEASMCVCVCVYVCVCVHGHIYMDLDVDLQQKVVAHYFIAQEKRCNSLKEETL